MQPIEGYTDEQLIDAFLAEKKKHRMTQTKAAQAAGIAQATVSDWTRGQRRPLQPETRKALESYLRAQRGVPSAPPQPWPLDAPASELGHRLDAIERMDADEVLKLLRIEAVSCAYRAAAWYEAEAAARVRAEALREAERASLARSEVIGRTEESAARRTEEMRRAAGGGTVTSPGPSVGEPISPEEAAAHGAEHPPQPEEDREDGADRHPDSEASGDAPEGSE